VRELSAEAVRQLYVVHDWSLTRIGGLVGRPPTWIAAVLERQGVARRPSGQKGRRRKPAHAQLPRPKMPPVVVPPTRLSEDDLAYAAARCGGRALPRTPHYGDSRVALAMLVHRVAPFQPATQAALRMTLGVADGVCWPAAYCAEAVGLPAADVQRLRKRIVDAAALAGMSPVQLAVPRRLVAL
jgi:hypothetical protein